LTYSAENFLTRRFSRSEDSESEVVTIFFLILIIRLGVYAYAVLYKAVFVNSISVKVYFPRSFPIYTLEPLPIPAQQPQTVNIKSLGIIRICPNQHLTQIRIGIDDIRVCLPFSVTAILWFSALYA
ncbi:hypothetical protein QUF80_22905, partial [Desulfococcaceae bacterium HSG8]|nr:hypothetical protein [Desulfococcaceae bacterium HSG8]